MWVSKQKWDDITRRVLKLERLDNAYSHDAPEPEKEPRFRDGIIFGVYPWGSGYEVDIPMSDAIRSILKHLGVKITKKEGKTEYVLEKVKKAAK